MAFLSAPFVVIHKMRFSVRVIPIWMNTIFLILSISVFSLPASAQYEFRHPVRGIDLPYDYFQPVGFSPFSFPSGIGVSPGFIDEPVSGLTVNPANVPGVLSFDYIGVDFNSRATIRTLRSAAHLFDSPDFSPEAGGERMTEEFPGGFMNFFDFPTEKQLDRPVLSIIYLGSPATTGWSETMVGFSYQLIRTRESYFPPESPFAIGLNQGEKAEAPANNRFIPAPSSVIPRDDLNRTGHQLSLHLIRNINPQTRLGFRISGMLNTREGYFSDGYTIRHDLMSQSWFSFDTDRIRNQEYNHLDVQTGLQYHYGENLSVGWSAGLLFATTDQQQSKWHRLRLDKTRNVPPGRFRDSQNEQYLVNIGQSGHSFYSGPDLNYQITDRSSISGHYRFLYSWTDVTASGSWIFDFARQDTGPALTRPNVLQNQLNNEQTDESETVNQLNHRLFTSLKFREWNPVSIFIGVRLVYQQWLYQTRSDDRVEINWRRMDDEETTIQEQLSFAWTGRSERRDLSIPVQFRFHISNSIQFLLGGQWMYSDHKITEEGEYRPFGATQLQSANDEYGREITRMESYAGFHLQPSHMMRIELLGAVVTYTSNETLWFQPDFGIRIMLYP